VHDYVIADVEIHLADGEVAETRNAAQLWVPDPKGPTEGRGQVAGILIDDLAGYLTGKAAGDSVTIEATGPGQHENQKLRDAKLTLSLRIARVERMKPLEMNQLVEMSGFDSEQELRDQVRFDLERRAAGEAEQDMHKQVTDAILERIDFELPEGLSSRQTERILQRRAMELMYRGASEQDIEQAQAELRASSAAEAQRELKLFFVLSKAAEQMNVTVSEHEINGRLAEIAMQSNRRPEKLKQEMARAGRLEQIHVQLREQRVIEKILEDANITEVQKPAEPKPEPKPRTTKKKTSKKTGKKTAKSSKKTTKKTTKKKTSKKSTKTQDG
jgi:trigger factor